MGTRRTARISARRPISDRPSCVRLRRSSNMFKTERGARTVPALPVPVVKGCGHVCSYIQYDSAFEGPNCCRCFHKGILHGNDIWIQEFTYCRPASGQKGTKVS